MRENRAGHSGGPGFSVLGMILRLLSSTMLAKSLIRWMKPWVSLLARRSIAPREGVMAATILMLAAVAGCAAAATTTTSLSGGPPQIPHSLEGREGICLACHETGAAGAPIAPASHAGRTNDMCALCHQLAAAMNETTTTTSTAVTQTTTDTSTAVPSSTPMVTAPTEQPANMSRGGDVYTQQCAACHGPAGTGGFAPALNSAEFRQTYASDAAIADLVRAGKGVMPALGAAKLSDEDMADLIAYLRSLK